MLRAIVITDFAFPGTTLRSQTVRTATGGVAPQEIPLPAGVAGVLSDRGGDSIGTITFPTSHGFAEGELVDVYWAGGLRYGMTIDPLGNGLYLDVLGGAGDVLPAQDTAVVVAVNTAVTLPINDTENLVYMAFGCNRRSHLEIRASSVTIYDREIPADGLWCIRDGWADAMGYFDGLRVSNGGVLPATFRVAGLYNSVPNP